MLHDCHGKNPAALKVMDATGGELKNQLLFEETSLVAARSLAMTNAHASVIHVGRLGDVPGNPSPFFGWVWVSRVGILGKDTRSRINIIVR